ncbi:LPXTG cell wall anchor domain-containing protein [Streptomyces sp. NPDC004539]|uniref:LPXTG cell wall anchor domain-containing protein n=1 Tax=Streptomyces sp. NPDC004539 TaxID=3154280 RepID=UPI0033A75D1E
MRRTARGVVGAFVLAGVVALTGAGVAVADTAPSAVPSTGEAPSPVPSVVDSTQAPSETSTKAPTDATAVPTTAPSVREGQVAVVPSGAADTGVGEPSDSGPSSTTLVGVGAGSALLAGGAFVVVRRRRATGE